MKPTAAQTASLQTLISRVLTSGLVVACAVTLLGGALLLAGHSGPAPDLTRFHPEPASLRSLPAIVRGSCSLDGASVTLLGALLLVATPVARVALAMVLFAAQRDRLYVAVSLLLLAVLVAGLLSGSR